jgi:glycosyltransferase involved in cell wall biosynthesis
MSPSLSVVICSLNGAEGVDGCLCALRAQTIRQSLEVIVVDDGSTDSTSQVARAHGVIVVRHGSCRGISAARNSGIMMASAPIVAFLDDDCEPEPRWAEQLIAGYDCNVIGLGGPLLVQADPGIVLDYLARRNPLDPQELDLAKSENLAYRLLLYLRRQWLPPQHVGRRQVFSLASANMSVRRAALLEVGGFDERIRFGSEDEDLCRRLARTFPTQRLIFDPRARVVHYFKPSLRDMLRRSRAYGAGSALMYRKWLNAPPTFFPFPVVVLVMLAGSFRFPFLVSAALLLPYLFYPKGLQAAIGKRNMRCLLDPYLQLMQEASDDFGFLEGLLRFRHFESELCASPARAVASSWERQA